MAIKHLLLSFFPSQRDVRETDVTTKATGLRERLDSQKEDDELGSLEEENASHKSVSHCWFNQKSKVLRSFSLRESRQVYK